VFRKKPGNTDYDEMLLSDGGVRSHYDFYSKWLESVDPEVVRQRSREADTLFHRVGITFTVYGEDDSAERLIPFDILPRVIPANEWATLEAGLKQRVTALNMFLHDIYHEQNIIKAGIIAEEQIVANDQYLLNMKGLDLPNETYTHIAGVDIIRNNDGEFYVLEDNLRVPSGVSYMLQNRQAMMRLFPELFSGVAVEAVDHYPSLLLSTLRQSSDVDNPNVVVMTPGRFNSAYFEHAFLAQQMGVELVEGADLVVKDAKVYMRTTSGLQRVDVIYRRIDDQFLDPLTFLPDSMLGVPGLMAAYLAGNVILANAPGAGIGDDKAIYPHVPDMVRFYLDEEPLLHNVKTWKCRNQKDLKYVLSHLEELVVKEVHGAGGYGMLIGPKASKEEIEKFRQILIDRPDNYIAQPTLSLSSCPVFVEEGIAPRHIDLRPFVLTGREINIVPGGLTRVALKEGSLVVNSSQGGGTKDTWVLEEDI
jgi:uncharacterized circularly permuted ATP-grasp superfamily protein